MNNSKFKFICLLLALALCLSGCSSSNNKNAQKQIKFPLIQEADPNGKLVFALGGEVSIINPILSSDTTSAAIEGPIFAGLIRINEKLEVIPDLARSWKISKDGLTFTFYLRRDVKWHDGHPFTAEDIKFTFDSILDPKVNSVRRSNFLIDGKPIKFKVVDKYTLQAVLPKPFAPFLVNSGIGIIPKHILQGKDINTANFNRDPIGTGPFKFKSWAAGDSVILVRNEDYYDGKPLLSEIIFRIIPDENSRLVALEAGEIDESGIPPKDYTRMLQVNGLNIFEYDALLYTYLGLNLKSPIFKDKKVRQALAYATNKDQLIKLIYRDHATPAYAPQSPVSWAYSNDVPKYLYDIDKATALLNVAGWKDTGKGIREKDGKKLEFTALLNQGNKEREKAAVILQQQYKKVGIKMNIRVMEWSALLKIINAPKDPKDFDAVIIGWSLGVDPDDHSIWHSSQYPRGLNFIGYSNPEVDRLLEQGRTTMDKMERKKIYAKLNKLIAEDQPYVFLWYPKVISGIRDRVGGLSSPGPAGMFLYIEKVFVKK